MTSSLHSFVCENITVVILYSKLCIPAWLLLSWLHVHYFRKLYFFHPFRNVLGVLSQTSRSLLNAQWSLFQTLNLHPLFKLVILSIFSSHMHWVKTLIPSQGGVHVDRGEGGRVYSENTHMHNVTCSPTDHVLAHAWFLLRASCLTLEIKEFRCYEAEIESEKAGSHWELNPGHPWLEPPVLCHCMSHDSQTTTTPHNPLYVLQRWYWMPLSHTWQPFSMCCQNFVVGRPDHASEKNMHWVVL